MLKEANQRLSVSGSGVRTSEENGDYPVEKASLSAKNVTEVLFASDCHSRVLCVFKAYFDESGHHAGASVFAMAGYLTLSRNWYRFEREWRNVLSRFNIGVFHAVDYAHRKGEFGRWPEERRRDLLDSLLKVIYRKPPKLWGIGSAVDIQKFGHLSESAKAKVGNDPYWLCFQICITEAANFIDHLEPNAKVSFVFHRKDRFEYRAIKLFNKMKDDQEWPRRVRLGAATFGSSSEFVPLQAADLIAYEVFKDMETKARGESRDMRYPLRRIVAGPQKIYNFDERSLKLALETEDFDH